MRSISIIFQLVTSILLVVLILLQAKGTGLGHAWGGAGDFYKNRRGVERILFQATVVIAFLFLISSVLSLVTSG